jgi:hypothetical protein
MTPGDRAGVDREVGVFPGVRLVSNMGVAVPCGIRVPVDAEREVPAAVLEDDVDAFGPLRVPREIDEIGGGEPWPGVVIPSIAFSGVPPRGTFSVNGEGLSG